MALGKSPKAQQRAQQASSGAVVTGGASAPAVELPPIVPGVWQGKPPVEADFKAVIKRAAAEQAAQSPTAQAPEPQSEQPLAAPLSAPVTALKPAKAASVPIVAKEGE